MPSLRQFNAALKKALAPCKKLSGQAGRTCKSKAKTKTAKKASLSFSINRQAAVVITIVRISGSPPAASTMCTPSICQAVAKISYQAKPGSNTLPFSTGVRKATLSRKGKYAAYVVARTGSGQLTAEQRVTFRVKG